jgi:hypothetical protein
VAAARGGIQRRISDRAKVARDLISEHFLQSEAEQMGGVATVGVREDVATASSRASWAPVTGGAAVGKPGDDRGVGFNVADAVTGSGPESLGMGELALKELSAAHDRAKRVARDQKM